MEGEPQRRSIQDIVPPARSRPIRPSLEQGATATPPPPKPPTPPSPLKEPENSLRPFVFLAIGVIVIGVGAIVLFSTVFHRASVTVTPYRFEAALSTSFDSSPEAGAVSYERVTVEDSASKVIPATGTEQVSDRATGTITVYNAYSTTPQKLITNTRFQTPDGLIYKVHNSVSVPGYITKAGVKVPGSIDITVYADEPGDKYNVGLSDFTLPGLKNEKGDIYKLVYAKSKTPMSGGFVGTRAVVDAALKAQTVKDLEADLERTLRTKLLDAAPSSALVLEDTIAVTYATAPDEPAGEGSATIRVSGTAVAPAFPLEALAAELARSAGLSYEGPLTIENPNDLTVTVNPPQGASSGDSLTVTVAGSTRFVAVFDEGALIADLAGKSGSGISAVRGSYPGIETMNVKVYPFWRGSIPESPDRIQVKAGKEPGS